MSPLYWSILIAFAVLIVGMVFGVAGVFLAPILGVIALVVLIVWLLGRKAQDKPPVP
jgi:predicted PurR-regulated permease PerM